MNEAANKGGLIAYAQTMCVEECARSGNLLQRVSDAIKRPFYRGAGGVHSDDDRDRNSSSDETILDGGRARGGLVRLADPVQSQSAEWREGLSDKD